MESNSGNVFLRRTEISDAPGIAILLDDQNTFEHKVFGTTNVVQTIEKAILGITAVDSRGHIVGHASFSDAPTIKGVHPRSWHLWLDDEFENSAIKPINSIALSLFVVIPDRAEVISTEILRTLFVAGPTIENCLLVLPENVDIAESYFDSNFKVVARKNSDAKGQQLFVCNHSPLNPKLFVRKAEPEDFDDLTPVFNQQSEVLQSQYGADEFFMAELIEAQSDTQKCVAAVVDERAVGLMCLTTDVATDVLQECFECKPYDDLENNVFTIAMFCIAPDYVSRSIDVIAAAFDAFPSKTYAIITMPHDVAEIPLLQHFTKVSPQAGSNLPHEMWLMHKHALLIDVAVRPFTEEDRESVSALTNDIAGNDLIAADLDRVVTSGTDPDGTVVEAYVATSCDKVVGVVVCRSAQEDAAQLRAHYNIEEYILYLQHRTFEQGHLNHFVLNPIFERHSKFVLREAMRLSAKSCIYHRIYEADDESKNQMPYTVPTLLDSMVPVRHRRQIEYPNDVLKSNVPSARVRHCEPPFALTFLNRKLMLETKIPINLRIVVVGNSDTALAFLETLFMKPHLRFTNLTLVAPDGLPREGHDDGSPSFLSTSHSWSQSARKRVSWSTWVNVVDDKLAAIDRDARVVELASGAELAYDYLVLAPGVGYDSSTAPQAQGVIAPQHVDVVNSGYDAAQYREWIEGTFMGLTGQLIVYGGTVDAFAATNALLATGVPAARITQMLPNSDPEGFGSEDAAALALRATQDAGVEVLCGLQLLDWGGLAECEDQLGFARFTATNNTTGEDVITRECDAFVCFHNKSVDTEYFHAVNDCHLVFDGRLVVNNRFCTDDERIYAAGPFTKFSRKYYATHGQPQAYNDEESGVCLANVLLGLIDPIAVPVEPLEDKELPKMEKPTVVGAYLAGGLQYLHVKEPVSYEVARDGSKKLVTTANKEQVTAPFFSLTIGESAKVTELCCVGAAGTFSTSNLMCLYNKHEKILNKVVSRYDEGLIDDLFAFFRQAWVMAVYHDRFPEYMAEITERVGTHPTVEVKQLEELSIKLGALRHNQDENDFREDEDAKLLAASVECITGEAVADLVKTRLMDFLTYNAYHLPMYARPTTW